MVLGGGPNRIGQGIEFDYCCVHAALALREDGFETIMVNCNPETVSTDYDTSDRLYFEPLTLEDVLEIVDMEKPVGVIVQFGGQTPLKLARDLEAAGVPIIGTIADSIDMRRGPRALPAAAARAEAAAAAQPHRAHAPTRRSSCARRRSATRWWCARATCSAAARWRSCTPRPTCERYMREAVKVSNDSPVLIDRFLNDAIEVDVDAVSDGKDVLIGGDHGAHRAGRRALGRLGLLAAAASASRAALQDELRRQTVAMAEALNVVGLMNVQFAIQDDKVYVLEVNPRASRTVPFVSKATGHAARQDRGALHGRQDARRSRASRARSMPPYFSVKEAVFPFIKFPGVDTILGPGDEVHRRGDGRGPDLRRGVREEPARRGRAAAQGRQGVPVRCATRTSRARSRSRATSSSWASRWSPRAAPRRRSRRAGLEVQPVNKVPEGRPHIVDMIKNGEISLIVNTVEEDRALDPGLALDPHHGAAAPRHLLHDHRRRPRGLRRHEAPRASCAPTTSRTSTPTPLAPT